MTPEELLEQQRRLGIAMTAADRAARSSGDEPASPPGAFAPLAEAQPFEMPDPSLLRARASNDYADEAPDFVPAGYVLNPAATNFGRLSTPRTDIPRFVPADAIPQGMSPLQERAANGGIDVRSYSGSRYVGNNDPRGVTPLQSPAAITPMPAAAAPSSLLPVGNLQARDAILRAEFPRASRAELSALGNLSYNRPGVFNAAMAGTRLDPALVAQRADATRIQREDAERRATQFEQEQIGRGATQNYFAQNGSEGLATAARMGADAGTLTTLAGQERARAQYEFDVEQARERAGRFDDPLRPVSVFGSPAIYNRATGNVMTQPQAKTPAPTTFTKLLQERAQAERAGSAPDVIAAYDEMIANERKPRTTNADVMMEWTRRFGAGSGADNAVQRPAQRPAPQAGTAANAPTRPAPAAAAAPTKPAQAPQQFKAGQRVRQGDKVYQFNGTTWVEIK
jgi:hypothetical protein